MMCLHYLHIYAVCLLINCQGPLTLAFRLGQDGLLALLETKGIIKKTYWAGVGILPAVNT
jgi:hypothetical protein